MKPLEAKEANNFKRALEFTLPHEVLDMKTGSYHNDPDDPGGETKWGIAKKYHPNEDIKNMTKERATEIYYEDYWVPCHCGMLDYPDCVVVFDSAVNPGRGFVQSAMDYSKKFDWQEFIVKRMQYYIDRIKKTPSKQKYLGGWTNRVVDLKKLCVIAELDQQAEEDRIQRSPNKSA